jgi:uncharacterized membrane protein YeaQ/YmgE (transglycosylase-associated protein family)
MSVIAWIVIGLLAGWLATRIMGGRGGLMHNLAVGLVGAIVGGSKYSRMSSSRSAKSASLMALVLTSEMVISGSPDFEIRAEYFEGSMSVADLRKGR